MPALDRTSHTTSPRRAPRAAAPLSVRTLPERRDLTVRVAITRRVASEYDEMPGLRLTAAQAQRLFGLREDICTRVFETLVDEAVLRRDADGHYRRHGHRP